MTIDWATDEDRRLALAWKPACRKIESLIELNERFAFVPVLVDEPSVARALAVVVQERGWSVQTVEPRSESEWRGIFRLLMSIDPTSRVVVVSADESALLGFAPGLQLLNQRRDTVASRLECTLLWCGSANVLRETGIEAPDLWSIREVTQKLEFEQREGAIVAPLRSERELLETVAVGGCRDPRVWREFSAVCEAAGRFSEAASAEESAAFFSPPEERDAERVVRLYERALGASAVTWTDAQDDVWDPRLGLRQRASVAAKWRAKERGTVSEAQLREWAANVDREPGHASARTQWLLTGTWRGEGEAIERVQEQERHAHAEAIERLWERAERTQIRALDANANFVRVIFAVGFQRVGRIEVAKRLVEQVEAELPAFDAGASAVGDPNPILLRMYIARLVRSTRAIGQSLEAWELEVESIRDAVPEARRRDRAELFRRRSVWIGSGSRTEIRPSWQHRSAEDALKAGEADPPTLPDAIAKVFEAPALFDHERADAIERALKSALRTGNERTLGATLDAATPRLEAIAILGHRASAIGACLHAAAALRDAPAVERLLDQIALIASMPEEMLSVRDLLLAVNPGFAALREMGAGDAAARLLHALSPIAAKSSRDALRSSLAEGFLHLREGTRALDLLDSTIDDTLKGSPDPNRRYAAMATALVALRRWPMSARATRCARVFDEIESFQDHFSTRRFFATYKLLTLENIIDTLTAPEPATVDVIDREHAASVDHLLSVGALSHSWALRRPPAPPLSELLPSL
jgi:hypothetical protein